jgi:hypothetical protein
MVRDTYTLKHIIFVVQLTRFEAPLSFSASAVGAPKAQVQSSQEIKMAMVRKQYIGEDMKAIQSRNTPQRGHLAEKVSIPVERP